MEDLELLEIIPDSLTHTSDYFDQLYDLATKLIKSGKAYADDTEQIKVAMITARYFSLLSHFLEDAARAHGWNSVSTTRVDY